MLRKLEVVVLQVREGMTHVAFAGEQLAGIVKRLPIAKDAAAAAEVIERMVGDQLRPNGADAQFRRGQVKVIDVLGDVIGPFVALRKTEAAGNAAVVDNVDAGDLGLLAAVRGEGRY